jgi:2-polyprenyl-6-methoxyphenol hydroxylase-like FAD-dependent oxidoreductase
VPARPAPQQAFARFEALRRPRVERIIKVAARINSNKTARPLTRVFRYHIDWDTPTSSVTA